MPFAVPQGSSVLCVLRVLCVEEKGDMLLFHLLAGKKSTGISGASDFRPPILLFPRPLPRRSPTCHGVALRAETEAGPRRGRRIENAPQSLRHSGTQALRNPGTPSLVASAVSLSNARFASTRRSLGEGGPQFYPPVAGENAPSYPVTGRQTLFLCQMRDFPRPKRLTRVRGKLCT